MTIAYANLVIRNERRIRLLFSGALASAAFGPGADVSAFYVVTCIDGSGANPGISAAIPLAGSASNVDLALNCDLVQGGQYQVTTAGVPGADDTFSPSFTETFTFGGLAAPTLNIEQPQDDLGALVYGVDLVWTGADFLETPAGDLATISGVPNFQGAMTRRLEDEDGLPWAPSYGAKSGSFVNGPAPNGLSLVASLRRQAVADDRVASATVTWTDDPSSPGDNYFPITIIPRGASSGSGFVVKVNPQGTT